VLDGRVEHGDLRGHGFKRICQVVQTRIGPLFDRFSHFCAPEQGF
jgi:hypothetical protein